MSEWQRTRLRWNRWTTSLKRCQQSGDAAYAALRSVLERLEDPKTRTQARIFLTDLSSQISAQLSIFLKTNAYEIFAFTSLPFLICSAVNLQPLARQTSRLSRWENSEPVPTQNRDDEEEDEEEEFYSPRGSSGDRDSSNGNGSGSRRVFAAVAGGVFDERGNEMTSCSFSSSELGSPSRSHSISLSPPVSLSPNRRIRRPHRPSPP